MPAFAPTIGRFNDLSPRGWAWWRWIKHHPWHLSLSVLTVLLFLAAGGGWWWWQQQVKPAHGGEVQVAIIGQPSRLNPLFSSQNPVDAELTPLIFRGLLRFDSHQQLQPDLASEWQQSSDGKTYSLSLGHHSWQDGQPVTTEDVAFTIHLTQDKDYHGVWSKSFTDVTVQVVDDEHLKLILKEPYAPFGQSLTMGILPKHLLQGKSITELETDSFNLQPIGTGTLTYLSTEVDPQTHQIGLLSFKPIGGYLDQLTFHFYSDFSSALTDFKLGKVQQLGSIFQPEFSQLASAGDSQLQESLLGSQAYGLFFNLHSQKVQNPSLRQALAFGFPKSSVLASVFGSHATPLSGVYNAASTVFSQRSERYDYNIDQARQLWGQASPAPTSLTLLIPDVVVDHQLATQIASAWSTLGVKTTIKAEPVDKIAATVDSHSGFDLVLLGEQSDPDPDRYSTWHSTQQPPTGQNITGESNPRVDKPLEDGRKALTDADRLHDYDVFQYYLAKDVPVIWLYQPMFEVAWSKKVHGVKVGAMWFAQDQFASVDHWYIKTQR